MRRYFPQLAAGHWGKPPVGELTLSLTDDLTIVDVWAGSAELRIPSGLLSSDAKAELAAKLTALHSELAGIPRNWVHIVFQDYAVGSGFTAGEPAAPAALTLLIRTGRSPDYKRGLLKRLWELLQSATGAPQDQIVIGIQELAASQAMEMGQIMPEVSP